MTETTRHEWLINKGPRTRNRLTCELPLEHWPQLRQKVRQDEFRAIGCIYFIPGERAKLKEEFQ